MNRELISANAEIRIPFHDIDVMEITWHGHYVKYFELARCELLDKINYNYPQMKASGYGWPVIDMHLRYIKPCRFGQDIVVEATLTEWEHRLRITYKVYDKISGERLSKGRTDQVAIDMNSGEMCLASPDILLTNIEQHYQNSNKQKTE